MQVPTLREINETITKLIAEDLGWEAPIPQGELAEHLDSIQKFSLVVAIEDHYEICFEPEEGEQIHSFAEVISLVHKKLEEK